MFTENSPTPNKPPRFELGGFSTNQTNVLIGLTITTILALVVFGFTIANGLKNPYQISPTLDPTLLTPEQLPTFPATWTPAPSSTMLPKGATATQYPTATPMATFTPYTPYPTKYSNSTIQPYEQGGNLVPIGTSVAGRPIEVIRFGFGPSARMIVAGIHGGNEWNTTALADQLIEHLKVHPELIPADKTLYILRSLNPDGLNRELGITGRVNDNGVDLNRNWDANWEPEWSRDGCWDYLHTTSGEYPNSEPETQTLINFLLSTKIDALINYHSAALGIFPGGLPPDPYSTLLAEQIAKVSDYPYPPLDTGCIYSGALVDWTSLQGIGSVDLELTNHKDTDFEQNLRILSVLMQYPEY